MLHLRTRHTHAVLATAGLLALAACGESATQPLSASHATALSRSSVTDPTATWEIPLDATGLNLKSDGMYRDASGVYSLYADGVCGLSTTIFATTAASNSGDATINSGSGGKCSRQFVIQYPDDGAIESFRSFNNLHELENTTFTITQGSTVARQLVINPASLAHTTSRCGTIYFGQGAMTVNGVGSDSVLVTRVDASTWHVHSQASPNDLASCAATGALYHMQVDFTIVSSRALP